MSNLSPAAQAVLTAAICNGPELEYRIADALRAAADQVAPENTGFSYTRQDIRAALLAIADELEKQ